MAKKAAKRSEELKAEGELRLAMEAAKGSLIKEQLRMLKSKEQMAERYFFKSFVIYSLFRMVHEISYAKRMASTIESNKVKEIGNIFDII